jgi:serine/threonine protein phosphatase PrpC
VYDGLGGAGAATLCHRDDGTAVTEAYIASRLTRLVLENWFMELLGLGGDAGASGDPPEMIPPGAVGSPEDRLCDELRQGLRSVANPHRSRVAGSLRRQLPTTLASVEYRLERNDEIALTLRWVGDSRVYLLGRVQGLQQLTLDDTGETDALKLLLSNPPMSNVISADRRFRIKHAERRVVAPAVLICATDGYFGYVASPAHFEHLVLCAIMASQDLEECARQLAHSAAAITGDDASIVLVAIGFGDWQSVQEFHRWRANFLDQQYIEPLRQAEYDGGEFVRVREDVWNQYRVDYNALLPVSAAAGPGEGALP